MMVDTLRRCLAIVGAILAICFLLHLLRFVAITGEIRGVCAGLVGYLVAERIVMARGGRRRR